jgi:hypothetical protein
MALLTVLRRQSGSVSLYARADVPPGAAAQAVVLPSAFAAVAWLNFWRADRAAMISLRSALHQLDRSGATFGRSDGQLIDALGIRLASGELVMVSSPDAAVHARFAESEAACAAVFRDALYRSKPSAALLAASDRDLIAAMAEHLSQGVVTLSATGAALDGGGWPLIVAAQAAVAGEAGVESAPVVSLASMPDPAPVVPLLPVLEEVQIEGAGVLPEIDQSLEQIDLTMGSIDSAGVSLQPTPAKIAAIDTTMTEAGKAVDQTLKDL